MVKRSELSKSFLSPLSVLNDMHGHVATANIVLSYLRPFDIVSKPDHPNRKFNWIAQVPDIETVSEIDEVDPMMLYICTEDSAQALLAESEQAFALVITTREKAPAWVNEYKNQTIMVSSTGGFFYLSAFIGNLFTSLFAWEGEMNRIVLANGDFSDLLDMGTFMLNNFMCVTDSGYNLVARTTAFEPPTKAQATLVKDGCYNRQEVNRLEANILIPENNNEIVIEEPTEDCPYTVMHLPMYFDSRYLFHLTMVAESGMELSGAKDFFEIFCLRMKDMCSNAWNNRMIIAAPWHKVLASYIEGKRMKDSYVNTQLEGTDLIDAVQFRLLSIDVPADATPTLRSQITAATDKLNGGKCYPFSYKNELFALIYQTEEDDYSFSAHQILQDVKETVNEKFGVTAVCSKTFYDLIDLEGSYEQLAFTKKVSTLLDAECELAGMPPVKVCYNFDYALPYYIILNGNLDKLVKPSVTANILMKINEDDKRSGSETIKLLWTYLCHDRNVTAVSKQLHMHRNTVLYHINKLEKRFDFNFGSSMDRNMLLTEFHIFFLTNGFKESIDHILLDESED